MTSNYNKTITKKNGERIEKSRVCVTITRHGNNATLPFCKSNVSAAGVRCTPLVYVLLVSVEKIGGRSEAGSSPKVVVAWLYFKRTSRTDFSLFFIEKSV